MYATPGSGLRAVLVFVQALEVPDERMSKSQFVTRTLPANSSKETLQADQRESSEHCEF